MKTTILHETVGGRTLHVEIGPFDGRLSVSIGVHRERDGRGVWVNVDAARELPRLLEALERAMEIADG